MCGSDIDVRTFGWSDYIWVYDNEPRNREIVNRISKTIDRGDKVIIWPSTITEKDINDMILSGHNVMSVLESNTYSGLEAKVQFTNWKKI
jgi:tRNA U54 and U55 pseudouridine synthase Pus10